jgi:polyhydroxyalkanoate synthesis repressor PhaR
MELIKKYSNRRLYDTTRSRYISLDELAETVRAGKDVRVVDAKTEADLTQLTLAQIIFESKSAARLLPPQLLTQLIRLSDGALAEFLGQYVSAALDLYLQAKQGAQALAPYVPFGAMPFGAQNPFARLWSTPAPSAAPPPAPAPAPAPPSEVAAIRRELNELKASLRRRRK